MSNSNEVEVPIIRPKWLNITEQPVTAVMASQVLNLAIGSLADGQVRVASLKTGETVKTWIAHNLGIVSSSLSKDQKKLCTTGEDNKLCVWDLENFKKIFEWKNRSWIDQTLWTDQGLYFSSAKKLYKYSMHSGAVDEIETWSYSISAMSLKNQHELGVAGYSRISLYDLTTLKETKRFEWKGQLNSLIFSPKERYAVCASQDLSIHIWDIKKDKDLSMRGFPSKIRNLSFRFDGLYMANCSGPEIIVWDYMEPGPANKKPQVFGPFEKEINFVQYQNKGKTLASFGDDGVILFWRPDLFDDQPLAIAGIRDQSIQAAIWTDDDQHVLTGLHTGYIALYPAPEVNEG